MTPGSRTSRVAITWARARDSLWFVPGLSVLAGTLLATIAVQVPTPETTNALARTWLFGGGAEGARGVLAAIAGSLITVTGVVFSVTIVALQLASSQFTPRVLGSFVADRVNQLVLGIFIGTFTYTLLVLRTIRAEADARSALVPHVAVTLALLLLLVSIAALIIFINHSARSIQASVVLERETSRTLARIAVLFPEAAGQPDFEPTSSESLRGLDGESSCMVLATHSGYLQAVDANALLALHRETPTRTITLRMELDIGSFAFPGTRLATVWPAEGLDEAMAGTIRRAFVLGSERSIEQDVEFGMVIISDIALRALSPGINDPTTAIQCIDRLTELLAALGTRRPPRPERRSDDSAVRLFLRGTTFPRALAISFKQIRIFGAGNPAVVTRLLEALTELATVLPQHLHAHLRREAIAIVEEAHRAIDDSIAQEEITQAAATLLGQRASTSA